MMKNIPHHTFLALSLFLWLLSGCDPHSNYPAAINGTLDLSRWDFEKDGIVALDGQWEFYWKRLLTPVDFIGGDPIENSTLFSVPGLWAGFSSGKVPIPATDLPHTGCESRRSGGQKIWRCVSV